MPPDVRRIAAFADPNRADSGNPAGVMIAEEHPSEPEMQRIAADVGYSETAFLHPLDPSPGGRPRYRVRYFTPTNEVPFCGHATIASAVVLAETHGEGPLLFELNDARVPVEVEERDGRPFATLTSPAATTSPLDDDVVNRALILLRWSAGDLDPDLPVAEADAGNGHLIVPLRERWILADLRYDRDGLAALCAERNWVTVHCVWRENDTSWHARDAAPAIGIDEDPATGAAAAAFGGYLRDQGVLEPPARFQILQGEDMGRPSVLHVELDPDDPGVRVAGTAVAITA